MKRVLFILPVIALVASCGILGKLSFSDSDTDYDSANIPAWDGRQKLCGEEVDFVNSAVEALPEFADDERIGFCARTMKYLALHRRYGDQTNYFGIAAISTGILAGTYVPMMQRATSDETWAFLLAQNLVLDSKIDAVALDMQTGKSGSQRFTNRLITEEQKTVQTALETLETSEPETYAIVIEELAKILNPTNPFLLAGINRNPLFASYEASLAEIRTREESDLDYSDIQHRRAISAAIDRLIKNITPPANVDGDIAG